LVLAGGVKIYLIFDKSKKYAIILLRMLKTFKKEGE